MKDNLIYSVIGFDFNIDLIDIKDQHVLVGFKTTHFLNDDVPNVGSRIGGETWFTNFNKDLLNKIKDYKRLYT
jgi:hypothetical protein